MSWLPLPTRVRRGILSHRLRRRRIPARTWHAVEKADPLFFCFDLQARLKLRVLASEILWRTHFFAARGMELTEAMKACLAARIAIVVFGLENPEEDTSLGWLRNWREIIVYPGAFKPHRQSTSALGSSGLRLVMHNDPLESGETSYQGPLVISWRDSNPRTSQARRGQALIHELAHKLDMLDGYSNGHPPLHASMDHQVWHDVFQSAFLHLRRRVEGGHSHVIDAYAATSPSEFFAVCSEYFFTSPQSLRAAYPDVYAQLCLFYRQQPLRGH